MQPTNNLLARVMGLLETDARQWGLSRRSALVLTLLPILVAGGVAALAVLAVVMKSQFRPVFRFVTAEDSLLEWPQFFFVLLSSLIFGRLGVRLLRSGQRGVGLLYLLLAAGALFVAGEEISWGQRIFGWGTPETLDAINHQGETNVHNIRLVQRLFGFVVLAGGLYGIAAPLYRLTRPRSDRPSFAWLLVPPLCLVPAFFMPFAYRALHTFVWPSTNFIVVKYGEAPELCLYLGLMVFAWLNLRRFRPVTAPVAASEQAAPQHTA
ncbi:MAG: hypothetical protein IPO81_29080 [Kouleothrix sp.]|nr:hypothetical protein [Kouleothrix sp.]